MKTAALVAVLVLTAGLFAQTCDSAMRLSGDWKPGATAPHDGKIIEIAQTFGIAPWYGRFYWRKPGTKFTLTQTEIDHNGKAHREHYEFIEKDGAWASADDPGRGLVDDQCMFWRPTAQSGKYVDPTRGAQNSISYWCAAAHRPYNAKLDKCE